VVQHTRSISPAVWNTLIAAVIVAGSALIWASRVQPAGERAVGAASQVVPGAAAEPAPLPGHPAPDLTLTTPQGEVLQLSALEGQVVLVNVWATWCPPCRAEMPAIEAAYAQYREQGFVVLAVNLREDQRAVADFMAQHGLTFPALLDTDGAVSARYQARVVPSSFFVDRRGVVRAVYRGPMPRSIIAGTVEQLLREAP
jgi:peroxiredoxin